MSAVVVVAPHPDDEAIGCGGAVRRHVLDGDDVHVAFLTSGERGGHGLSAEQEAERREREAAAAAAVLGLASTEFWREPDAALTASRTNVARLRSLLERRRPERVYAPHPDEQHPDHRAAWRITRAAVADLAPAPELLLYEVWTPLTDIGALVDITDVLDDKLAAIRAYAGQCSVVRFDDAFTGLARYRGEMHLWPGGAYAEAFARGRP